MALNQLEQLWIDLAINLADQSPEEAARRVVVMQKIQDNSIEMDGLLDNERRIDLENAIKAEVSKQVPLEVTKQLDTRATPSE